MRTLPLTGLCLNLEAIGTGSFYADMMILLGLALIKASKHRGLEKRSAHSASIVNYDSNSPLTAVPSVDEKRARNPNRNSKVISAGSGQSECW